MFVFAESSGTQFKYSNTAYLILGFIIEKVSGKSYEEFLRERIFMPLKMTSTMHIDRTRVQRNRAEAYTHQAPLYDVVGGIELTSDHLRRVPELRQLPPQADGGLLSTIDDLHKWTRALLGDNTLDAAFVHELLTPNQPGDYASGWFIGKRFDRDRITHNAENGWLQAAVKDQFVAGLLPESETLYYAPMWEARSPSWTAR